MSVLVGKPAPDFTCSAVLGSGEMVDNFNLADTIKGKVGLVFFYPLDFSIICPSELLAVDHRMDTFKKLGVEVIGVSIDSHFTHKAWRNTAVNDGGIGKVSYTLAADINHDICRAYDVQSDGGMAFRGAFIIDQNGVVRSQTVNDLPLGRNFDEFIRVIEALQFYEEHGEVSPAG
ncbi:antioxidant, AhpC/Tsa family protein [marine gamma proteobacterium HTCC2143]|jgi:peroxiredoxin (alkyl hydroperoxide reductase subunit C)|uniref:Thioredoxin peroxidase n=1 Tax=marine gamma proteobacterium HTCC2143 TaxID=247633 RepID=A0YH19_9GAMM|nr:antioxidant, AhpC/Tsa family protein [marine gamma proteobacterium HTCC2143]